MQVFIINVFSSLVDCRAFSPGFLREQELGDLTLCVFAVSQSCESDLGQISERQEKKS